MEVAPEAEAVIVKKTDALRSARGMPEVRRDEGISDAARRWSLRMAATGEFEHSDLGWSRGRAAGENIAMAPTPQGAFEPCSTARRSAATS